MTLRIASRYAPPQPFSFSSDLLDEFGARRWHCPVRLVVDGAWAKLWRPAGPREAGAARRGGGIASAVLPVLALHVWPEHAASRADWTRWAKLPHRRVAALAGVSLGEVRRAFDYLARAGWLEHRRAARGRGAPPCQEYRLSAKLYPAPRPAGRIRCGRSDDGARVDEFAQLPGTLIYGGTWRMLPTHSARHLYVVLACLDGVLDEEAMRARLREEDGDEASALARIRARTSYTIGDLADLSGMDEQTVAAALRFLTCTVTPDGSDEQLAPLIESGCGRGFAVASGQRWYAPNRVAAACARWSFDEVNGSAEARRAARAQWWPWLAEPRGRRHE